MAARLSPNSEDLSPQPDSNKSNDEQINNTKSSNPKMNYLIAVIVGIGQAIAILPGLSRSGSTISFARFFGIKREECVKFSFLLSIPVIFGSFIFELYKSHEIIFSSSALNMADMAISFVFAYISGLLAIKFLTRLSRTRNLNIFAIYCIVMAVAIFIVYYSQKFLRKEKHLEMKGVILAGGLGSRLFPCTKVTNKHLLPVYNKPMIYYPLNTMVNAGLKDIMIVTGGNYAGDFLRILGNGKEFGLKDISYTYQEGEGGIAEALKLAENFAEGEKIFVILGDNIIEDDVSEDINDFEKQKEGAGIFLKEVPDPERFGVAEIKEGKVINIEEKPKNPKSNYAVCGLVPI